MRLLQATLVIALATSTLPLHAGGAKKDEDKLQGKWVFTEGVINGLPVEQKELVGGDILFVISGNKMTRQKGDKDGLQNLFTLDSTKTPKTIDSIPQSGRDKGKTIPGIYHLENDTLKICVPLDPEKAKRPTEFAAPPKSGLMLMTLKRVK
jgi:uncharacterized protein (TIGR03067 family)